MKCDRALLSAYLDNELKAEDRRDLELHVTSCADCAERLEQYRGVRFEIRDEPIRRAPPLLRSNLESRIRERRRQHGSRWLPIALGAPLSLIGVLAGAALVAPGGESSSALAVTATSPMTGAKRVALNGAVELWFDRDLMPGAAGLTVTVDPPIPVRVASEGNAVRIEPDGAFEPGQSYTVAVESVVDVDGRRLKNPAVVSFVTASVGLANTDLGSPRGESLASAEGGSSADSTSQSALASVPLPGIGSVASSVAPANLDSVGLSAQTRKWPVSRSSGSLPMVEPSQASIGVADTLGPLQSPYQISRVLEQAFQGGVMIRIGDTPQALVLQRSRGTWESFQEPPGKLNDAQSETSLPPPPGALAPTGAFAAVWQNLPSVRTALGWAVYEPRVTSALVQHREKGTALTLGRMAYLLRADGTWSVVSVSKTSSPSN
ncbi:MAG TPA: Ig-like domain-containing protein [Chloroflexota bacterium]|jgi:anti-sigma factor RsiW|nr:Ig-like domain-containing protein [Chloroflexota bacterium]